ncbi:MAG: hypothetical protein IAI50_08845, partial [Candidatus Eremiobacteraeota bacterium]|nr:hypothetical protein [Candidatus Eremiobacteraeota bacterium]
MNVIVEREKGPLQELEGRIVTLRERGGPDAHDDVRVLEQKYSALLDHLFGNLTPWERVI